MDERSLFRLCPEAGDVAAELIAASNRWGIDTPLRQAHWLAQMAHESRGFERLTENLNYSADALLRMFSSRIPDRDTARRYERRPEAIGNRVYSNRLGNGDEASGDGWRYRGRGYMQITGRSNYRALSLALFGDERLVARPELLEEPLNAALAAGRFWHANRCNHYADLDDVEAVSGVVNRGSPHKPAHGLADRMLWLSKAKEVFGLSEKTP